VGGVNEETNLGVCGIKHKRELGVTEKGRRVRNMPVTNPIYVEKKRYTGNHEHIEQFF